ncbi:MAG TPA: DUF2076 domain-containing protein [Xanthobacteraceae bacterium]|jgi:hypothetical protein|nr:DUF2076 domain-containing protein [Xanthobacteraceae bacterium]
MTPQERQLVADLFDRLARLESQPRDRDAERAIAEGLQQAPHAVYALVQTVLVQDEALKRADARIRDLEASLEGAEPPQQQGGFLDSMRNALLGREAPRGSVPSVRPGEAPMGAPPGFRSDPQPPPSASPQGSPGGSFLGTAAASAAGVIGGAMLLNSIRSMFGGHASAGAFDPGLSGERSPWGGSAADSDLAREAGLDDIGGRRSAAFDDERQSAGLFGSGDTDDDDDQDDGNFESDDGDYDDSDYDSDGYDSDDTDVA